MLPSEMYIRVTPTTPPTDYGAHLHIQENPLEGNIQPSCELPYDYNNPLS